MSAARGRFNWLDDVAYEDEAGEGRKPGPKKKAFHAAAARVLKTVAAHLGHPNAKPGHNYGGIAVSGEITLDLPEAYVLISQETLHPGGPGVLVRRGRESGLNAWLPARVLDSPELIVQWFRSRSAF